MTAWLPEAAELEAYEGIRRGDEESFRVLAGSLQPTLRRLAGLYVDSEASADAVVLRSWEGALRGLDMFCWHTPLATWIAGIVVATGRARDIRAHAPSAPPIVAVQAQAALDPPDWSDLPWGGRWEHAAATLAGALAALPVDQREVVHGRDVEQWPFGRVCDVFALPEVTYQRLLADARTRLHDALAPLVGQTGPSPHHEAQVAAISRWLNMRLDVRHEQLDPRTMTVFHRWWATRQTGWRRLAGLLRQPLTASGRRHHALPRARTRQHPVR